MVANEVTIIHQGIQVPQAKQTALGLYVTAQEAFEMGKADPENVKVLDVRMVEDYVFLGHAEGAVNIPVALPKYQWHADKRKYGFEMNPDFIDHIKELFSPDDTIVAMGRSGGRSAFAINILAKAGFTNLYNIIDGFEGDTVNDPESVFHGKRMKNGWKNSAPWTYDLDPALVWIPTGEELEKLRSTMDLGGLVCDRSKNGKEGTGRHGGGQNQGAVRLCHQMGQTQTISQVVSAKGDQAANAKRGLVLFITAHRTIAFFDPPANGALTMILTLPSMISFAYSSFQPR